MTKRPLASRRILGVALLTLLALLAPVLAGQALGGSPAVAAGARAAAYDHSVHQADCTLLGREYVKRQGCSRTRCTDDAVLWRKTYGAEACTLRRAPDGYGYAATVDSRLCTALNRKWIAQVNYCASEPDRSGSSLSNAPQCTNGASVYVPLEERLGYYDECITLGRAAELAQRGALEGRTLAEEVSLHSAVQCPYRPGQVYVGDTCVDDPGFSATGGGVLVVGDSLTWRGTDELGRIRPTFTIDGEPARPATDLASRLDFYRSGHGDPDGLIIELGSAPAKGFGRQDLVTVLRSLPKQTRVMFVLPYYVVRENPLVVTPQSKRIAGWMRDLGRSRKRSCTADWPAYVRSHPGTLQDGVHTVHRAEGRWASWVSQQWARC